MVSVFMFVFCKISPTMKKKPANKSFFFQFTRDKSGKKNSSETFVINSSRRFFFLLEHPQIQNYKYTLSLQHFSVASPKTRPRRISILFLLFARKAFKIFGIEKFSSSKVFPSHEAFFNRAVLLTILVGINKVKQIGCLSMVESLRCRKYVVGN